MKSQEELFNMTVMELREYMNSLSNEEIKQAAVNMMSMKEILLHFFQHLSFLSI